MKSALANFQTLPLKDAARQLLAQLGYKSNKCIAGAGSSPQAFLELFGSGHVFDKTKALFDEWKTADLLSQLTDQELSRESSLFTDDSVQRGLLKSYIFIAIELKASEYARGKFSAITRQINRLFPMPVMVFFKHQTRLTIAVINRRRNKIDENKDVLEKATIIRDINFAQPHRGHLDILDSLALPNLVHPKKLPITDFDTLHAAWEQIFNVELLNERFYRELANWYFWALPQVEFPSDLEPEAEKRRATGLIRLLTRLIFCWFLKEKNLIPEKLFHPSDLAKILKGFDPESETSSNYYQAILQNLFFATLNQRMGKDGNGKPYRKFVFDEGYPKNKTNHDLNNYFRYENLFALNPDEALALFEDIPFLNGGLFECLDKRDEDDKKTFYLDGFSRNATKRPHVPDRLFFDSGETADLSEIYGDKKRKAEKVTGLISILNRYKFTIVENTPIDQEIALDPELLGKVFENLLASYNEETKTTARKQTGSFYTPRPIVEYMVDESLKAHLTGTLSRAGMSESDVQAGLDILFAYTEREHPFHEREVAALLDAIHTCKILDPACGSGAFPMGMLHKLVYIIHKLDPDNARWKQLQIDTAAKIPDSSARDAAIAAIERDFADNEDDYGRKLYLIENCLYGVDIQPIAIQISKLRFFISLICDQHTNRSKKENHGIRPLPNLETKFVAADTLVGLPIPEPDLFIKSLIEPIEKEIERAYHSHFSIQRRDQKLALQTKIKNLRLKLSEAIVNGLGANKDADIIKKARHVAEWDAFDPQVSSDFFDPHWMFGPSLADGFDIVFGNPPWGAQLSKEMKAQLKIAYPDIDSSTPNSFAYFIGAAIKLAKSQIAYVLPDAILIKDYAKTRRLLRDLVTKVDWYLNTGIPEQFRQFVYVDHDVCVLILDKTRLFDDCTVTKHLYDAMLGERCREVRRISKDMFILPQHEYCFNLLITQASYKLMKEMERGTPLGDITQSHEGIHTGNCRDILFHKEKINPHCKPLFYGGRAGDQIDNYHSIRSGWFVDYRESIIDKQKGYYASLRDERIFKLPKIYITRTGNPIKAFFDSDTYASNNFFSLQFRDYKANTENKLKAILPLILSSVANYYIRNFAAPRLGNTYIETKIIHLDRVPVSDTLLRQSELFSTLTDVIIASIKLDVQTATQFLEDLIDACVMECYFREHMAERDLLFLNDLAPHLSAYDPSASESNQRECIVNLHRTLNAPASKIRNRLLRISADSPDLLAVIKQEGAV